MPFLNKKAEQRSEAARDEAGPTWQVRRTIVVCTLMFCAAITLYLAVWGESDPLRSTIANGVLFLAGSVIMAYIFGVVWSDKSFYGGQQGSQGTGYYGGPPTYPPEQYTPHAGQVVERGEHG